MARSTLAALAMVSALIAATGLAGDSPPRFAGEVDVVRLLVDLRAIDRSGDPVSDLLGIDPRLLTGAQFQRRAETGRIRDVACDVRIGEHEIEDERV